MAMSSKCKPRRMSGGVFLCLSVLTTALMCVCDGSKGANPLVPYVPPVTLGGYLNGDTVFLPGTRAYPNTCVLDDGMLKMEFYSEDYYVATGMPSVGRHFRIWIYPPRPADSNQIKIVAKRVMLHGTSHEETGNCTWGFDRDSVNSTANASLTIERYSLQRGASLYLYDISLMAPVVGAAGCPLGGLDFTKGRIEGRVQ